LQIARLLEKKGDPKAALAEYQRFLTFWAHADADLAELAEARRPSRASKPLRLCVARVRHGKRAGIMSVCE
jgi:hypothetical protein